MSESAARSMSESKLQVTCPGELSVSEAIRWFDTQSVGGPVDWLRNSSRRAVTQSVGGPVCWSSPSGVMFRGIVPAS